MSFAFKQLIRNIYSNIVWILVNCIETFIVFSFTFSIIDDDFYKLSEKFDSWSVCIGVLWGEGEGEGVIRPVWSNPDYRYFFLAYLFFLRLGNSSAVYLQWNMYPPAPHIHFEDDIIQPHTPSSPPDSLPYYGFKRVIKA